MWFVAYILMCYLITPFLEVYRDKYIKSKKSMWLFAITVVILTSLFFGLFNRYFKPAWMTCYVLGYALGVNERGRYIRHSFLVTIFGMLALICNGIQIYLDYVKRITLSGQIQKLYDYFCNYSHVLLGIFLFLVMKAFFEIIKYGDGFKRFLDKTDMYSYETYLVHQLIILGPFRLMAITPLLPLNIVIILVCIFGMAWLLKKAEDLVLGIIIHNH